MRRICLVLLFFISHVYCQDYMNVELSTGYKYVLLDDISKITFSTDGSEINFVLTSGNTATESVDDVVKIVFATESEIDVTLPEISVQEDNIALAGEFKLYNNYPNPFNPATTISYEIMKEGITTLTVYDILGKEVEVLVNHVQTAGNYEITFNGANYSSGVYFCRISSGGQTKLIKILLVK